MISLLFFVEHDLDPYLSKIQCISSFFISWIYSIEVLNSGSYRRGVIYYSLMEQQKEQQITLRKT